MKKHLMLILFIQLFSFYIFISIALAECEVGSRVDSYENVSLYSNGCNIDLITHWQCVEFAKRFYFQKFHYKILEDSWSSTQIWHGNGDVWHEMPGLFARYNKKTIKLPEPGDTLSFRGFYKNNSYPHVAIVSSVSSEQKKVHFVQQNVIDSNSNMLVQDSVNYSISSDGKVTLGNYKPGVVEYEILGWGHRKFEPPKFSTDGVTYDATYGVVGQALFARSVVHTDDHAQEFNKIGIGGRFFENNSNIQDIGILHDISIPANETYTINVNKTFYNSGDYTFSLYADIGGSNPLPEVVRRNLIFSILDENSSVIVDDSEYGNRFEISHPIGTRNVLSGINTRKNENLQTCGYLYGSLSVLAEENHIAIWKPGIAGEYAISAFIPSKGGYANVNYEIVPDGNLENGVYSETVCQQEYANQWVTLRSGCTNRWQFSEEGYVRLRAVDANGVTSNRVAIDAIKFMRIPNYPDLYNNIETGVEEDIFNLTAIGAVKGYPDGQFRPDGPINRAEFLKILIIAVRDAIQKQRVGEKIAYPGFPDVDQNAWYAPYVTEAYEARIINGFEDGYFHPDNPILRAEAAKMILTSFDLIPNDYDIPKSFSGTYADIMDNQWYAKYVARCCELGLMGAYKPSEPNIFGWDIPLTRAESAHIINSAYLDKIGCIH